LNVYQDEFSLRHKKRLQKSFDKALNYLEKNQREDGSWLPLWFGNQQTKEHTNPVYGTAKVVTYLKDSLNHNWLSKNLKQRLKVLIERGTRYLVYVQNGDGSWGAAKNIPGTMEETALAVSALASVEYREICESGLIWLNTFYKQNGLKAAPIGLYFASLWYDEKLYPVTAYLEALSRMLELEVE
jgi:squalene-hopene/tetraprenyl-beta-curcumene cyclase